MRMATQAKKARTTGRYAPVEVRSAAVALRQGRVRSLCSTGKQTETAARSASSFEDARRSGRPRKLDKTAENAITKLAKGKWGRGSRVVNYQDAEFKEG